MNEDFGLVDDEEEDTEVFTPALTIKEFKVKDVFDALVKNGFEYIREEWFTRDDNGNIVGACVLGQAALNLYSEAAELGDTSVDDNGEEFYWGDVDTSAWGFYPMVEHQLNRFEHYTNWQKIPRLGMPGEFTIERRCASTIIIWNDAYELDAENETVYLRDERGHIKRECVYGLLIPAYALKTYEEVTEMAREVLEPFFNEIAYLRVLPEGSYNIKLPA